MYKPVYVILFLMTSLIMLVPLANTNNIFSNVMAQPQVTSTPSTGSLTTGKAVFCQSPDQKGPSIAACQDMEGKEVADPIQSNDFLITVTGNNPNPSQFFPPFNTHVNVTLGPGNYTVSEMANSFVANRIMEIENNRGVDISEGVLFTEDCTRDPKNPVAATGTIAEGEVQKCFMFNFFTASSPK